jgi:hypothetical protein
MGGNCLIRAAIEPAFFASKSSARASSASVGAFEALLRS